jgi:hypothetical protein
MDTGREHEFTIEDEETFIGLSESLYRFGIMFGVLGLGIVALGITVFVTQSYGGTFAGPVIAAAGLVATVGGFMFLKPRASFDRITTTRGRDITRLMNGVDALISAHGLLRVLLVIFVVARLIGFIAARAV